MADQDQIRKGTALRQVITDSRNQSDPRISVACTLRVLEDTLKK